MSKKKLRKSILAKVPVIQASKATVSLAKRNEDTKYYIYAVSKIIDHQRILLLHVYHRDTLKADMRTPQFRIFLTKTDYISQYYLDGIPQWRTGRMDSLMEYSCYGMQAMCCDESSENAVRKYLGNDRPTAVRQIRYHQEKILAKRLQKKHKKIQQPIDRKMQEIRPLPKDFNHWVDKEGMTNSRYIFYRYSRRKFMDGYCTHCEQEVKVSGVRHRSVGVCPNCGSLVTFLAEGKAKHIRDWDQVVYFQKTKNGFAVRYFSVYKRYGEDFRHPELSVHELQRDFYEGNQVEFYEWREFKQTGKVRWCNDCMKYRFDKPMIYTKNLKRVLKGTEYQYCALKEYLQGSIRKRIRPFDYLREYRRYPFIEYLVKAGLYRLTYEFTQDYYYTTPINKAGKSLPDILGIKKQEFPLVRELDMSMKELRAYQRLCSTGIRMEPEQFLRFCERYNNAMDTVFDLLKHTTLHRIEKYCMPFVDEHHGYLNILKQWKDYIGFCEELGYDIKNEFVLFPKHLMDAHDEASAEILKKREVQKREQLRKEEKRAKVLLQEYRKVYAWNDGKFMVEVPKDLFSIKEEGHILHHCVGTYTSGVAEGRCIILFVRRLDQPEKPFYTMEIRDEKIIQCRGYKNQDMTEAVKQFIEGYKETVL